MSSQQHAIAVVLESIRVFRVDLTGARNITRDATLANVSRQGLAVQYTLQGTFNNVAGWTQAFSGLELAPFDENIATRVAADFTSAITVYTDLMIAFIEKHGVLTSPDSPLAPEGAIIGREIATLHIGVELARVLTNLSYLPLPLLEQALLSWFRVFAQARLDEIVAQGRLAQDAFELAAARYPRPTARGPEQANVVQVGGEVKVALPSEAPARK
ncbi:hypothetical protein C2E23DRAFT_882251 [Lenzites betulinus]|nr:hypothetical protein C2E23DRAFT_882251 [Lenzites betulinus]